MPRIWSCIAGAVALVTVSCQDHSSPTAALPPLSAEFRDAVHGGGNPHFYLLPPFVSTPDLTKETFESGLKSSVRITEMTAVGQAFAACTNEQIAYLPVSEFTQLKAYAAFWRPANFANVTAPCIYRLQVEVFGTASPNSGTVLGFADVQVISKTTIKYLKTGEYIPLPKDLTLPLWFFIGQGAVFYAQTGGTDACRPDRDCVEAVINPSQTNVVVTTNLKAGISIPAGAFASPNPVTLVIEEETARPCIDQSKLGLPQFAENRKGCYRYRRFPDNVALTKDLTVAMCVDVGLLTHAQADRLQIFRFDPTENEGGGEAQALKNVAAPFLTCAPSGFLGSAPRGVQAVLAGLNALFAPRSLHAATAVSLIHIGIGGSCLAGRCLSSPFFTWGILADVRINDGNNQVAAPGSALPISPSVVVKDSGGMAVAGAIVTFSVTAGNGTITGAVDTTGLDGIARVGSWTLPSAPGAHALTATLPGAGGSPVTFTATGTATISGYEVVTSSNFLLASAGGFIRETAQCPAGKVVLGGGAQVVGEGTADFNTRLQESAPGTVGVGGATSVWLVSMKNEDSSPHNISIFAVCANPLSGYEVVESGSFSLAASGGFIRQTAQCPAGKAVLGGGAQVVGEGTADFNTRLQESGPSTVGGGATSLWLVSMKNAAAVSHSIRIFAVCANQPTSYEVVVSSSFSLAASGGFIRETAACPAGKVVLGGGAQVVGEGTADFNTGLQESAPGTVGVGGATSLWLVSIKNTDASAHTVAIRAACANGT